VEHCESADAHADVAPRPRCCGALRTCRHAHTLARWHLGVQSGCMPAVCLLLAAAARAVVMHEHVTWPAAERRCGKIPGVRVMCMHAVQHPPVQM
jgi:hypothetical protein